MENIDFWCWDSSCARKTRFSHATHARAQIMRLADSGDGFGIDALVSYKCRYCAGFHIGHDRLNRSPLGEGRSIL